MRALLQRVRRASVAVEGQLVGSIGQGLCILLGVGPSDTAEVAGALAATSAELRIFNDDAAPLVDAFAAALRDRGLRVETGIFGADMLVEIHNDGPVTIWLDSATL